MEPDTGDGSVFVPAGHWIPACAGMTRESEWGPIRAMGIRESRIRAIKNHMLAGAEKATG